MKALKPKPNRTNLYIAMVLAGITFLVFANSIGNDYNLDDELVTNHQRLTCKGISAIPEIFTSSYFDNQAGSSYEYRPVTLTSFAIEHTFFDESPTVSHCINVLLYALTIMSIFLTLRSVLPGENFAVSLIATLLFALHPLHTEVVASIKNRDEILCFLGGILSWRYADRFLKSDKRQWLYYALFIFFFVFGILSKRSILSYVVIIPLSIVWFKDVKYFRLLLLSGPLALGFYLLSPASESSINIGAALFISTIPLVMRTFFYDNILSSLDISKPIEIVVEIFSFSEKETLVHANTNKTLVNILNGLWALVYAAAIGLLIYATLGIDRRSMITEASGLLILAALFSPKRIKVHVTVISIALLASVAFDFMKPLLVRSSIFYLGALFFIGGRKQRLVTGIGMVILAVLYLVAWPTLWSVVDMALLFAFFGFFTFMKDKKWGLLVIGYYTAGVVVGLIYDFKSTQLWLLPLVMLVYYLALWFKPSRQFVVSAALLLGVAFMGYQIEYGKAYNQLYIAIYKPPAEVTKQVIPVVQNTVVPAAGRKLDNVENPLVNAGWGEKTATSMSVMGKYVQLLLLPVTLRFYYGFNQVEMATWHDFMPWIVLLGLLASIGASLWFRERYPVLALGVFSLWLGLFFISNLPVLVAGIVAERLAFVASLGFCLALASALVLLIKQQQVSSIFDLRKQPFLLGLIVLIALGYSIRTIARNADWKDRLTLYSHDIESLPNSAKAQQLMGIEYLQTAAKMRDTLKQAKQLELAKIYLTRSMEIAPNFHSPVFNMAYLYAIKQDCDNAVPWMKRSLQMEPNMSAGVFHFSIAKCFDDKNKLDSAAYYYDMAIAETPKVLEYYTRLSYAYYRQGKIKESIGVNMQAIKQFPSEFDPYINAAKGYLSLNDNVSALGLFEAAYRLHPDDKDLVKMIIDLSNRTGNGEKLAQYTQIAKNFVAK